LGFAFSFCGRGAAGRVAPQGTVAQRKKGNTTHPSDSAGRARIFRALSARNGAFRQWRSDCVWKWWKENLLKIKGFSLRRKEAARHGNDDNRRVSESPDCDGRDQP